MNHWTRQLQSFSCENYLPRQLCTAIPIRCDKSPIAIPINHDLFHLSFLLLLKKNFCVWVFVLLFLGILLFHHRSCCRFFPYKMCSWDVGTETRERKKEKKCFIEENFGKRISFFIVLFVESFIYFTFSSSCCVDFMLFLKSLERTQAPRYIPVVINRKSKTWTDETHQIDKRVWGYFLRENRAK